MPNRRPAPAEDSLMGQVCKLVPTGMSTADIVKLVGCTRNLVYVTRCLMADPSRATLHPRRQKGDAADPPAPPAGAPAPSIDTPRLPPLTAGTIDALQALADTARANQRDLQRLQDALVRIRDAVANALS